MTWDGVHERRRTPRAAVEGRTEVGLELRARVRLVDISASGALLASDTALPIASTGQLKVALDATHFSPTVKVRRTALAFGGDVAQLGTVFHDMDDASRRSLEAFLKKAVV